MNPEDITRRLKAATANFDREEAARIVAELIAHLLTTDDEYPVKEAERALQLLRNKRMFTLMWKLGDALIETGRASFKVRRHYAQALIDEGNFTSALVVLQELVTLTGDERTENVEAHGLIGRVYKQLYVNAASPGTRHEREHLRQAVVAYLDGYTRAPTEHLWHGINVVALLHRAARDGVLAGGFPDADQLATDILATIQAKDLAGKADTWDFATAVEACIALGKADTALVWLARYVAAPYTDAFELASTLRQLTEVWQLDLQSEPGVRLLPVLRAELLAQEGGRVDLTPQEVQTAADRAPEPAYEKVLGTESYRTYKWYLTGAQRCQLVARIGIDASQGHGTGFVLRGSALAPRFGDGLVVLTNAHVVSDDPAVRKQHGALSPDDAVVSFEAQGAEEYRVAELLWSSPPEALDATILRLEAAEALEERLKDKLARIAKNPPAIEATARAYVIGHPLGGSLSLSLQDNVLLDYEKPRLHYRTPTEGGSSGSPVFNRQWDLIGLHHAGSETMPRLNGQPGTYPANEGIWLQAIIEALAAAPATGAA